MSYATWSRCDGDTATDIGYDPGRAALPRGGPIISNPVEIKETGIDLGLKLTTPLLNPAWSINTNGLVTFGV